MGFFFGLLQAGPALNRLAKTFDECFSLLRRYRQNRNEDDLILAVWLFTYGVIGSCNKWHWNMISTAIFIPNHMELGRITINQATLIFMKMLSELSDNLDIEDEISDIMDGQSAFDSRAYLCPPGLKKKLRP